MGYIYSHVGFLAPVCCATSLSDLIELITIENSSNQLGDLELTLVGQISSFTAPNRETSTDVSRTNHRSRYLWRSESEWNVHRIY